MALYKICPAPLWREALATGAFRGAPVDLADGFVHLSTARQVRETAARHFAGEADLLLLTVDPWGLGPGLRFEPSRGGDLFPHHYGEMPLAAVSGVEPLPLGPDGHHVFGPGLDEGSPGRFDPAAEGWAARPGAGFAALIGPVWIRRDGERTRYGFAVEPRHLNTALVVHGGMIMAFADQTLGLAAKEENGGRGQLTAQLDVHFVSGARDGEFVESRPRVVRRTAALVFMSGELAVGDRVVALAHGVWKLRARRTAAGG